MSRALFFLRVDSQWPDLTCYWSKLEKVDLPEIKGNHRKFRNLVTSYIGNFVYVCVHLSIFCTNVCMFVFRTIFSCLHIFLRTISLSSCVRFRYSVICKFILYFILQKLCILKHIKIYKTHLWCCFLILIFDLCLNKVLIWYQISLHVQYIFEEKLL